MCGVWKAIIMNWGTEIEGFTEYATDNLNNSFIEKGKSLMSTCSTQGKRHYAGPDLS